MSPVFDYTEAAADCQEIIDEFGREVSLIKFSTTLSDADAPWEGNVDVETTVPVTTVILDPKHPSGLGFTASYEASLVAKGYMVALVSGSELGAAVAGETYDRLVDGAEVWGVVEVDKLQPGDTVLLWYFIVEARR